MRTAPTRGVLEVRGPADRVRARAWGEAYAASGMADAVWIPEEITAFRGRLRRRMVQDLGLVDVDADAFGCRWTSRSTVADYVGVSVKTRKFDERVVLGNQREFVSTTSIDVWDAAVLVEAETLGPMAQTALLVPKSALRMSGSSSMLTPGVLAETDEALVRSLRSLVLGIAAGADRFSAADAAAARSAVVDLLLGVVQERRPLRGSALSTVMRFAVGRWIDDNLHLGELSPGRAAHEHHISVRSLHRSFADSGDTFRSVVRRRRLAHASRALMTTDDPVQSIAMRWGYFDASHFINDFKREHGATPAAYRKAHRTEPGVA
jgi:AraC family transcriptional activator of tynA and feaB